MCDCVINKKKIKIFKNLHKILFDDIILVEREIIKEVKLHKIISLFFLLVLLSCFPVITHGELLDSSEKFFYNDNNEFGYVP